MNNPYQAPMMNNPYVQSQNPYMDRMNFLQNYQQSLQQQPMDTSLLVYPFSFNVFLINCDNSLLLIV